MCYSADMVPILIATNNAGKLREFEQLLASLPISLESPHQLGLKLDGEETGTSYLENARAKALAGQQASGLLTLADDSGLEVEALDGEPGIYSARQGGPGLDDIARYELLLQRLCTVPWPQRTAHFRCVVVAATPTGEIFHAEGSCTGKIAFHPSGAHGFGYDPIFYLPEYHQSMSELSPTLKNSISHRARAVQAIVPILTRIIAATVQPDGAA